MFRTLFRFFMLLLVLAVLFFSFVAYQFFTKPLLNQPTATSIIIKPGSSLNKIAYQLKNQGLLNSPSLFIAWALLLHKEHLLKAGEYEIAPGMTAPQLLNNMVNGKVIFHKLTLVEGWTFQNFRQALDQNTFLEHKTTSLSDEEIMQALGSSYKVPEGLFFPETYLFTRGDADMEILQMAYDKMQDILKFQWQARAEHLPYLDAYHALIAASMIEKETGIPADRAQVSGVIIRRLQKGMRLQIDATLYYGLHESQAYKLTKADMQKDTPYNTYLRTALPPTPICMPSEESIYAALHPAEGDSLYYVARGDGSSEFSATYEKHKAAIAEYLMNKTQ